MKQYDLEIGDVVEDSGRIGIILHQEVIKEEEYYQLLFPKYSAISPPLRACDFKFLMKGKKLVEIISICYSLLEYEREAGNIE